MQIYARTFEARVGHVGHEKQLAVDIDALVRHEHFGANRRVQEKDDDDRELDCLRDGGIEREAAARKLARNASCIAREPLENNARNGEDDEDKSENADNDERLRGGVKMMKTLARRCGNHKRTRKGEQMNDSEIRTAATNEASDMKCDEWRQGAMNERPLNRSSLKTLRKLMKRMCTGGHGISKTTVSDALICRLPSRILSWPGVISSEASVAPVLRT